MNVEEALRTLEEKAAILRFCTESGTTNPQPPDPLALDGMSDAAAEIGRLARMARRSLDAQALGVELKRDRARS